MKPEKTTVGNILTTILTPVVGAASAYLAKKGLQLPTGAVVTLGVAGATATLLSCFHWLQRQTLVKRAELLAGELGAQVAARVRQDPATLQAQRDLVQTLEAQKDQILKALADAVHLPPSAEEVAQKIIDQAAASKPSVTVVPDAAAATGVRTVAAVIPTTVPTTTPAQAAAQTITSPPQAA